MIDRKFRYHDQLHEMTGGTGSLRCMAPEVANCLPCNHEVDVNSFGIVLCELLSCKKTFCSLSADEHFERINHMRK